MTKILSIQEALRDAPGPLAKIHAPSIEERDGKFTVVDDDGHVYGTHASRGDAEAQVKALYASKVTKGDAPGHPFRGNQYGSSADEADLHADFHAKEAANPKASSEIKQAHKEVAALHRESARAFRMSMGARGATLREAAEAKVRSIKLSTKKADDAADLAKGDRAGHPFYGNQHSGGEGGGEHVAARAGSKPTAEQAKSAGRLAGAKTFEANHVGGKAAHEAAAVLHEAAQRQYEARGDSAGAWFHRTSASTHRAQAGKAT